MMMMMKITNPSRKDDENTCWGMMMTMRRITTKGASER
jgi:hypothetical protein